MLATQVLHLISRSVLSRHNILTSSLCQLSSSHSWRQSRHNREQSLILVYSHDIFSFSFYVHVQNALSPFHPALSPMFATVFLLVVVHRTFAKTTDHFPDRTTTAPRISRKTRIEWQCKFLVTSERLFKQDGE